MLQTIISFSIRNKLMVAMGLIALIGFGIFSAQRLPIDAVPDITNNQVLIITPSPSLGAADIERLITFPIEQSTRNINGLIEQRSFSRFGLSLVTLVFNDDTDVYWARQQVSERLVQVQNQIPPELGMPEMGPVTTGLGEIFQYVVRPKPGFEDRYLAAELRTIQDWIIRRQLLGTPGVADVSSFGGKLKQYEIAVDDQRLKAQQLTIRDVFEAVQANNQNAGGAYIERGPNVLYIRSEGLLQSIADIEAIHIKQLPNGNPIRIRDVAKVGEGMAIRYGAMTYNNQGEVAGAVVMMLKGENSSQVIKTVKAKIADIQKSLPEGVIIEAFLDRTKMVNNAIQTVETNLLEGALIVVLVLVLFLGNMRAGLLVASVIPLSMLFALICMHAFGVSGNLMSLGALDFGLIIDGAVIIVEAVMHRLHHNKAFRHMTQINQDMMDAEVEQSASKMMNAAVFGQIIILIVYLPILSLEGIEGKMFKPMAQTVAFALLGAFLLSLTYVPMMSTLVLSKKMKVKANFSDRMMGLLEKIYQASLLKALAYPKTLLVTTLVAFVTAVIILMNMGGEFIPKLEEGDFAVDTRVLTGSSLTTTIQSTQKTADILLKRFPEVEKVVTKIGSGEIPTDPMPMEASDMMVILKPKKEWTSAKTFDELAEKMSTALQDVPGVTAGFQFPVQMRFNELMTGGRQDVVCKIYGENLDTLAAQAEQLGSIVHDVQGAKDIYVETIAGLPQVVVNYNREALAQFGLDVATVNQTIQAAYAGAVTGQVFEGERRFDLVVRLDSTLRTNTDAIEQLMIPTPRGQQIPLGQVAQVTTQVGPNQIQRENAQRRITVGFNVRGRDVETLVHELQEKVQQHIKLPTGYQITYGGQFENLRAAKARLAIAVPVSLILILLMLYFAFRSVKQGLLIYTAIPLSAIGGVFALLIRDMPFSISAGVGFIALFGVAVLNGIVLITEFNLLRDAGVTHVRERILKGTRIRLRPVLMTAAVASLGFIPMAFSNGAGAEVQRPLATVVIGGLITATALTLLLLPVLYQWVEQDGNHKPRKRFSFSAMRRHQQKPPSSGTMIILLLMISALSVPSFAQKTVSLQSVWDSIHARNGQLEAMRRQTEAIRRLEQTSFDVNPMQLTGEYGQLNSAARDTRFAVSQSFQLPTYYQRRKTWLTAQTKLEGWKEAALQWELYQQATRLYYMIAVQQERALLLQETDSLYRGVSDRQQQRFSRGDITRVEYTSVLAHAASIQDQLRILLADQLFAQRMLAQLMQVDFLPKPIASSYQVRLQATSDSNAIDQLPALQAQQQLADVANKQGRVYRAAMHPSFSVGYSNMSAIGFQNITGMEKYYSARDRLSTVQLGIGIPLFNQANKARVQSAQQEAQAAQLHYQNLRWQKQQEWNSLRQLAEEQDKSMQYYQAVALPQAQTIFTEASKQFQQGAISYLEWQQLMQQSIHIRMQFLQAAELRNETAIRIYFLTHSK